MEKAYLYAQDFVTQDGKDANERMLIALRALEIVERHHLEKELYAILAIGIPRGYRVELVLRQEKLFPSPDKRKLEYIFDYWRVIRVHTGDRKRRSQRADYPTFPEKWFE